MGAVKKFQLKAGHHLSPRGSAPKENFWDTQQLIVKKR